MTTPPLLRPPATTPFRAHTAGGALLPARTEAFARSIARGTARSTNGPVAVERWDPARQEWTLVDLAQPS